MGDQSDTWCWGERNSEPGCWAGCSKEQAWSCARARKPVRPFLALATGSSGAGGGATGVSVARQAVRPEGALLTLIPSALRTLVC